MNLFTVKSHSKVWGLGLPHILRITYQPITLVSFQVRLAYIVVTKSKIYGAYSNRHILFLLDDDILLIIVTLGSRVMGSNHLKSCPSLFQREKEPGRVSRLVLE